MPLSSATFQVPDRPRPRIAMYNGKPTNAGGYKIGFARSGNGDNWTSTGTMLSASVAWEGSDVFHPWLVWDGSQYVLYYAANAASQQIGRATSTTLTTWTKYASNPVIPLGATNSDDVKATNGPVVYFDAAKSPSWKMWYAGQNKSSIWSICFADSTDGITWTKRGKVLGQGSAGTFTSGGVIPGCVYLQGSTWYVFLAGIDASSNYHAGYVTCTTPSTAASYSAPSALSNFSGNVTIGGKTWQKNQPRSILAERGGFSCYLTLWGPTDTTSILETGVCVKSSDLISWNKPGQLMLSFDSWSAVSAENPTVMVL